MGSQSAGDRGRDDGRRLRRGAGVVILLLVLAAVVWGVPRLGGRSPVMVLLLMALAILAMKLAERLVGRWLRRLAARRGSP